LLSSVSFFNMWIGDGKESVMNKMSSLILTSVLFLCVPGMSLFAKSNITIKKDWIMVDGERFLVKGIGYSNIRPNEQPNTKKIDLNQEKSEFQIIRDAGFNTIRTWKPLSLEELNLAHSYGLYVIQGMWIDYNENYTDPVRVQNVGEQIKAMINESIEAPNVLMVLVGNEPYPPQVFSVGIKKTEKFFKDIRKIINKQQKRLPGTNRIETRITDNFQPIP